MALLTMFISSPFRFIYGSFDTALSILVLSYVITYLLAVYILFLSSSFGHNINNKSGSIKSGVK